MIDAIINESIKKFYLKYILGLLLCKTRKTCVQMSEATSITHDTFSRALNKISKDTGIQDSLVEAAKLTLNKNRDWWLVLDDSMLLKPHAKKLCDTVIDRCGATGKIEKGLVAVFLAITDGDVLIPLGYEFWISRKKCENYDQYKKKWEIGLSLIEAISVKLTCKRLLMDGTYANKFSLKILMDKGFEFEARFRKNGALILNTEKKNVSESLDHFLVGPQLYKTIHASWQGLKVCITAHKHRNKSGESAITYTISKRYTTAQQHAKDYRIRWRIEMFFRTTKQSLGIQHCASPNILMQQAHINACLITYVFLQYQRNKGKYHSIEDALYPLRNASIG